MIRWRTHEDSMSYFPQLRPYGGAALEKIQLDERRSCAHLANRISPLTLYLRHWVPWAWPCHIEVTALTALMASQLLVRVQF